LEGAHFTRLGNVNGSGARCTMVFVNVIAVRSDESVRDGRETPATFA
jgi:hypothetical protein